MKCHYINDKKAGRVLIPGCLAVVHTNDLEQCTCGSTGKSQEERLSDLEYQMKLVLKELKILNSQHG